MGFFKDISFRSKSKSTQGVASSTVVRHDFPPAPEPQIPKIKMRPPLVPPPPQSSGASYYLGSNSEDSESDPGSIIIGIDFGTTYSGVAWSYSKETDDIHIITDWDSSEYESSDKGKAPTRLSYKHEPGSRGTRNPQVTWGYGVEDDDEAVEWFKLLLLEESDMDDKQKTSPQIQKAKRLLQKANKTAVQAVGDYLRLLWAHTITNIKKQAGEDFLRGLPLKVVCTVPAIWRNKAISKMREAAKHAGILERRTGGETKLFFVSEPEAAALATFNDLSKRPNLHVGDTLVICDAGGGTVDLISYKITQTKPMKLAECVEGSGKLCGAVFLDQEFEAFMKQTITSAWDVPSPVLKAFMNQYWENGIKRGFSGKPRSWKLSLPFECIERGAPPQINLEHGYVLDIFEDVTTQIRALVNEQIRAVEEKEGRLPKAVILVGGFGSCKYLHNVLETENAHRGIDVYQSKGNKPWTAICRGAVLKGFGPLSESGPIVETRISRCNYGLVFRDFFDPDKHSQCDWFLDEVTGEPMARAQLRWYLTRGTSVRETEPVLLSWYRDIPAEQYHKGYSLVSCISTCDDHVPPTRRTSSVREGLEIKSDSPIDVSSLKVFKGIDGRSWRKVSFGIEMKVIGTALEFALIYDGKRIGSSEVEAKVDI
ncbi:hypothetical protein C7974DRAFT_394938 [Boeremia exigua]|uniref:uncharacterized protein n=1 Tax=Boeremia exigua TaxID=749465 RepID=UPI001E8DEF5D|nr:uncharacterized protein C7974DRAFT_394938 [Boeremia exigua]KAH6629649.1 hypothetical protein C7974DRAFT_394938 [Boeremia exigua]